MHTTTKPTAKDTVGAAYIGYLTQAITINFAPLLFLTFEKDYHISLAKISTLIAISFLIQLAADAFEAKFSHCFNTRATVVFAHVCAVVGMTGFAWLPDLLPDPFIGLVVCVAVAAVGGGIIEVMISPIVEACPTENKSAAMSMLHSFYSWGLAGVILFSTLFFKIIGIAKWQILACLWAIIPAVGAILFCFVPIYELDAESDTGTEKKPKASLWHSGIFLCFFLMMFCAGAAEQAMGQWASAFAESGLGVSKTVGDILGPCLFAVLMALSRVFYGKKGEKIDLNRFIFLSAILCIFSYLLTALSPIPLLSLLGCALCGLSVGIMWPGTYSLASQIIPYGGIRMFALLALAGDIGCLVGPTAAGWIAALFGNELRISFLIAILFPLTMLILCQMIRRQIRKIK